MGNKNLQGLVVFLSSSLAVYDGSFAQDSKGLKHEDTHSDHFSSHPLQARKFIFEQELNRHAQEARQRQLERELELNRKRRMEINRARKALFHGLPETLLKTGKPNALVHKICATESLMKRASEEGRLTHLQKYEEELKKNLALAQEERKRLLQEELDKYSGLQKDGSPNWRDYFYDYNSDQVK